jgi:CDP-diacylglycerol--glycerol-3-phosphate 3-phosphatidyltransferase
MVCAPLMMTSAWFGRHDIFLVLAVYCMLSDIFDGKIARWRGESSDYGAQLDSWADQLMFLAGPFCAWWLQPQLVRNEAPLIMLIVGGNLLAIGAGFAKFGRLTSYHTRASRLTAYLAGAGAIIGIATGWPWLFRIGALVSAYATIEELVITATLREWMANIPSMAAARAMERQRQTAA